MLFPEYRKSNDLHAAKMDRGALRILYDLIQGRMAGGEFVDGEEWALQRAKEAIQGTTRAPARRSDPLAEARRARAIGALP